MPTRAAVARKATNITLSADVLAEAKALGINISRACDDSLRALVKAERERHWREEKAAYIAAYNRLVEKDGLPLEGWRTF